MEIKIPNRFSDNFGEPLNYLLNLLIQLNELNPSEIYFDFSESKFISPFIIGGIVSISNTLKDQGKKVELIFNENANTSLPNDQFDFYKYTQ